jgi:hypothetical protein
MLLMSHGLHLSLLKPNELLTTHHRLQDSNDGLLDPKDRQLGSMQMLLVLISYCPKLNIHQSLLVSKAPAPASHSSEWLLVV